jgi:hypothetical protein
MTAKDKMNEQSTLGSLIHPEGRLWRIVYGFAACCDLSAIFNIATEMSPGRRSSWCCSLPSIYHFSFCLHVEFYSHPPTTLYTVPSNRALFLLCCVNTYFQFKTRSSRRAARHGLYLQASNYISNDHDTFLGANIPAIQND